MYDNLKQIQSCFAATISLYIVSYVAGVVSTPLTAARKAVAGIKVIGYGTLSTITSLFGFHSSPVVAGTATTSYWDNVLIWLKIKEPIIIMPVKPIPPTVTLNSLELLKKYLNANPMQELALEVGISLIFGLTVIYLVILLIWGRQKKMTDKELHALINNPLVQMEIRKKVEEDPRIIHYTEDIKLMKEIRQTCDEHIEENKRQSEFLNTKFQKVEERHAKIVQGMDFYLAKLDQRAAQCECSDCVRNRNPSHQPQDAPQPPSNDVESVEAMKISNTSVEPRYDSASSTSTTTDTDNIIDDDEEDNDSFADPQEIELDSPGEPSSPINL